MKNIARACLLIALCAGAAHSRAGADDVAEILSVAWESYWHQSGYPVRIVRWHQPIRVRFTGTSAPKYQAFALSQLRTVADIAAVKVTATASDDASANLEVEFLSGAHSLQGNQPCATTNAVRNGVILRARIRANESSVWRCLLHESMHALGVPGHPHGNSILSYFGRDGQVSEADKLVLTTSYSSEVEPGMSPLPALAIVARRLVDAYPPGAAKAEAARAAQTFLRTTVAQMENFATGGEPPGSVLRSGKTTAAGLAQGRIETQFLLGAAYMEGQIVDADPNRGVGWLTKAAYAAHADAQLSLADAYARGSGVAADPVESYKWCYLAASQGGTRARSALQLMETRLRPDQVAAGKARAAAWQQSKS